MRLSILIPTHNRPKLFDRCLKSVLEQLDDDIEIIVNNDSMDINIHSYHPNIHYYFNKYDNLSDVYKFLLEKSTGEYVYFLEDDDYLANGFTNIELKTDLICGNYCPTYKPNDIINFLKIHKDEYITPRDYLKVLNLKDLQLSQYIFKRSIIKDFEFPKDNNIHNDINLVMHALTNSKDVKTLNKVFFYQTIDGNDNISFPNTNASIDIIKSMDFLSKYNELF